MEENSNVWSVWSDRIKSGGFGDVVGDLNKSTVSSGSDLVEDVCSLDFWGQGQSRIHLTIYCQWKKQSKICWLLLLYQSGTKVGVATVLLLTSMTAPFRTPLSFKTAKSWLLPRYVTNRGMFLDHMNHSCCFLLLLNRSGRTGVVRPRSTAVARSASIR